MNKFLQVKKRHGEVVNFDMTKIIQAIQKAFFEVYPEEPMPEYAFAIAENIENRIEYDETIYNIEDIQDLVEYYLMQLDPPVARAYIRYRYRKEVVREGKGTFFKDFAAKLNAENIANQNANVDEHSFGGRVGEASDAMMKEYALNFCMSKMARDNHLNNEIYIHDLSAYAVGMHNCLSVPFDHLLEKGFNTRQVDIRPANSVDTAFQLVAVIFQLQSLQQFGGVSATHLDWTMVPYVRKSFHKHWIDGMEYAEDSLNYKESQYYKEHFTKENIPTISIDDSVYMPNIFTNAYRYAMNMTERELAQAAEGLYHNLNSLQSRSGK